MMSNSCWLLNILWSKIASNFEMPAQSWLYLFPCALPLSNKFCRWHFLISTFFTIPGCGWLYAFHTGWSYLQVTHSCEPFRFSKPCQSSDQFREENAPNSKSSNKAALPHRWLKHCSSTTAVPMEAESLLELDPSSTTTTMIFWQKERIHSLSKTWALPPLWSLKTCANVSSARVKYYLKILGKTLTF